MNDTMGWMLFVSISAAIGFFVAGYVARMAIGARSTHPFLPSVADDARAAPVAKQNPLDDTGTPPTEKSCPGTASTEPSSDPESDGIGPSLRSVVEEPLRRSTERPPAPPTSWRTEGDMPPVSCPSPAPSPSESQYDSIFPPERTLPFRNTLGEAVPLRRRQGDRPEPRQNPQTFDSAESRTPPPSPVPTRPRFSSMWDLDECTDRQEDIRELRGLRQNIRHLGRRQRMLERKVAELASVNTQQRARLDSSVVPVHTSSVVTDSTLEQLLDRMPDDVQLAVVADARGLPLTSTGDTRESTELAATLGPTKRLVFELCQFVTLQQPLRTIHVEDRDGTEFHCWPVETDDGVYGVLTVRKRASRAPDELRDLIREIAVALSAKNAPPIARDELDNTQPLHAAPLSLSRSG
jgi:hypothetical protein